MANYIYQKKELLLDTSEIKIETKNPLNQQAESYTTYLIIGTDKLGSFEIRRRFSEFFFLRQGLRKRWPCCYIPPLPQKKITGNLEEKFIEDRRRFLEYFCKKASQIKYLYYCQIFQHFLRNKSAVLENMYLMTYKMPMVDLGIQYKQIFGMNLYKQSTGDLKTKIDMFYQFIKKLQKELIQLRDQMVQIAYDKQLFNQNLHLCNTILLPQYEKNIFAEYVNQQSNHLIFLNDNAVNQKIREFRDNITANPYDLISDLLIFQIRQISAWKQAIEALKDEEQVKKQREQKKKNDQLQLSKLMSGYTTMRSIFKKGNKNDQINILQVQILNNQKQIEDLATFIELVYVCLGYIEINKYKNSKQQEFSKVLNEISKKQLKYLQIRGNLLKAMVMANQNIKLE